MQTKDFVYIAMATAGIVAFGLLQTAIVPLIDAPMTFQSIGPMLAGAALGSKRGGLAVLLFLVLVALDVPVLAGGRGGLEIFYGEQGGFLLGFFPAAVVVGALVECPNATRTFAPVFVSCLIGGMFIVYAIGIPWMVMVSNANWQQAFQITATYVPGDIIKVILAAGLAMVIHRIYPGLRRSMA